MMYQVSTQIELGNLTSEVLQVEVDNLVTNTGDVLCSFSIVVAYLGPATLGGPTANLSSTSYFVACTLNATRKTLYLSMQDGRTILTTSLPFDNTNGSWTIWSPSSVTNLTDAASIFVTLSFIVLISSLVKHCQKYINIIFHILSRDRITYWK